MTARSIAAVIAVLLGLGHAATSAYWALGGDALLDTIGGDIERWAREGGATVTIALWAIVVVKAVVAIAALVLVGAGGIAWPTWMTGRLARLLGWVAAVVLVLYGGLLTIVGLLVEAGVVDAAADADERALAWHAYLWDPWFAVWGAAFVVALWRDRSARA